MTPTDDTIIALIYCTGIAVVFSLAAGLADLLEARPNICSLIRDSLLAIRERKTQRNKKRK